MCLLALTDSSLGYGTATGFSSPHLRIYYNVQSNLGRESEMPELSETGGLFVLCVAQVDAACMDL